MVHQQMDLGASTSNVITEQKVQLWQQQIKEAEKRINSIIEEGEEVSRKKEKKMKQVYRILS